jgi:hypothetical protein
VCVAVSNCECQTCGRVVVKTREYRLQSAGHWPTLDIYSIMLMHLCCNN